jgi:hypothetical protein
MRLVRRIALLSIAIGLGTTLTTAAPSQATGHGSTPRHSHVAPARYADGMTGSRLLAQAWRPGYELPVTTPQPDCIYIGRTGKVLLAGRVYTTCTVKHGYPVMYFFGTSCDTVSPPPWYAVSPRAQLRCARKDNAALIKSITLSVDDGPTVRISRPRFELHTRQQHVVVPVDNGQGYAPGPATFTADVWAAFATHLSLGLHTTHFTVHFVDGGSDPFDRPIRVVR